jgi:hypothetical protein
MLGSCPDQDALIDFVAEHELPLEVRDHITGCSACQENVAKLKSVLDVAACFVDESPGAVTEPMPADMSERIFAKATSAWQQRHDQEARAARWHDYARAVGAVAAAVLVQWVVSWFVLSLPARAALARIDWWTSLSQVLLATGVCVVACFVVVQWLRATFKSWRGVLLTFALVVSLSSSLGFARMQRDHIRADLNEMFLEHRWVTFDPRQFNPYPGKERMPTLEELENDLRLLRDEKTGAGFDALITFKANGTFGEIPRLAKKKEIGFKKVIMGIYVLSDQDGTPRRPTEQMEAAIAAKQWVDGYCLGHNTTTRLDIEHLRQWMAELRQATGKPVTTTAPLVSYLGERGRPLREIGDWYFPDVRGSWVYGAPPEKLIEELHQAVRDVTSLPSDRPVLLKMISCPAGPAPRFTPKGQADFYTWVARDLYLPPGVFLSYYNGFDLPWMSFDEHPAEWSPGQQYVGFFTATGEARPSVEVVRKGFPVQRRP